MKRQTVDINEEGIEFEACGSAGQGEQAKAILELTLGNNWMRSKWFAGISGVLTSIAGGGRRHVKGHDDAGGGCQPNR